MIKMYTAYTLEIDDVEAAVQEILDQLDLEHNLLQNAVGMITCYSEFVEMGVVAALCEKLPFDVVGCTTLGNTVSGKHSQLMLGLSLLTSTDIEFAVSLSKPLASDCEQTLNEGYAAARAKLGCDPKMMFSFLPLLHDVGGDKITGVLDDIAGGIPNFGTIAVDHTPDYHTARVLYGGESYADRLAMLLIGGDIDPIFLTKSMSPEKVLDLKAVITASNGNVLMEVNNIPIVKYMEALGLAKDNQIEGANTLPFMVDFGDGTPPLSRAIFATTPEGYAVCGGDMPVNATLYVGAIDYADVLLTTEAELREVLATNKRSGLVMFGCVGRYLGLGLDSDAELELIQRMMTGELPYMFAYSGGEVCPVHGEGGKLFNRFHNETIIACAF